MTTSFVHAGIVLAVRLPDVGAALSLWLDPRDADADSLQVLRRAEVRRFVTGPDGEPIDAVAARAVVDDAAWSAAYRGARDAELAAAAEGGTLRAQCPSCTSWRADLRPLALAVGLRAAFWPQVDRDGRLVVPALSVGTHRPLDHATPSSRLSVGLPGREDAELTIDLPGSRERLRDLWSWSERLFADGPVEDWTPDSPGWTALLRLAATVPGLLGGQAPTGDGRDHRLTRTPLGDVLFLDNVLHLTRFAVVPADHAATIRCRVCRTTFLPVAPSPGWATPGTSSPGGRGHGRTARHGARTGPAGTARR